jgi:hypothetical protein
VARGSAEAIRARIGAHFDAGASYSCLEPGLQEDQRVPGETLLSALAPQQGNP